MKPFTDEEIAIIDEAIAKGWECYWAFNKLACKLRLDFAFYGIELYNALNFLQGAHDYQMKKEEKR